jgi:phosphoenolpyruvate synthase/pyruvate phosphate dikinase
MITDQKKRRKPIKKKPLSPHRFEEKYAREISILFCAALAIIKIRYLILSDTLYSLPFLPKVVT